MVSFWIVNFSKSVFESREREREKEILRLGGILVTILFIGI